MATHVTSITAAEARRRRVALQSRLKDVFRASRERADLQIEYVADPFDRIRSSTDREVAVQRLEQQASLIHEIQSALAKIEDGSYGLCELCQELIRSDRLDAVPWARLCVGCQSKVEAV